MNPKQLAIALFVFALVFLVLCSSASCGETVYKDGPCTENEKQACSDDNPYECPPWDGEQNTNQYNADNFRCQADHAYNLANCYDSIGCISADNLRHNADCMYEAADCIETTDDFDACLLEYETCIQNN